MARDFDKDTLGDEERLSDPPNYESLSDLPNGHPPQHNDSEDIQALPRIHHAPHSSNLPRRGARRGNGNGTRTSPPSRLGAIDEQSNSVAPDVPTRNPKRKNHNHNYNKLKYLTFAFYLEKENVPPVDAYDKITGPNGEKFADLRRNKPFSRPGRGGWRKLICLGLLIVIILAIALGVGLGVGLTRRKRTSSQDNTSPSTNGGNTNGSWSAPFPIGTFTIPTFLTAINTTCTADPSTWRCYPYTTYTPSSESSSYSPVVWRITSPTNSTLNLDISATQPTFSYPFTNIPLTLSDANDNTRAAFTFTYTFRKTVVPSDDITGTGAATRCYYNATQLAVRLYANAQGVGGNVTSPPGNSPSAGTTGMDWPYAVEYEETSTQAPECFMYVNGMDTTPVNVSSSAAVGLVDGACACNYRNYDLS